LTLKFEFFKAKNLASYYYFVKGITLTFRNKGYRASSKSQC